MEKGRSLGLHYLAPQSGVPVKQTTKYTTVEIRHWRRELKIMALLSKSM